MVKMAKRNWANYEICEEAEFMENLLHASVPRRGEVLFWDDPIDYYITNALDCDFEEHIKIKFPPHGPKEDIPDIEWTLDLEDTRYFQDYLSVHTGTARSGVQYKYRHDLVSGAVLNKEVATTDQPLSTIMKLGDQWDHVTPDFIHKSQKRGWLVIEISTARTSVLSELRNRYTDKKDKYLRALQDRSAEGVTFVIIVVGVGVLVSSVEIGQVFANDLMVRMNIGIAIENKFLSMTGTPLVRADQSEKALDSQSDIKMQIVSLDDETVNSKLMSNDDGGDLRLMKTLVNDDYVKLCNKPHLYDPTILVKDLVNSIRSTNENSQAKDPNEATAKFLKELRSDGRRFDTKCVVNHPLIMPKRSVKPTSDIEFHSIPTGEDKPVFVDIWARAMCNYCYDSSVIPEDPTLLLEEALETDQNIIKQTEEMRRVSRKVYRRVDLGALEYSARVELAQQGLWAKSMSGNQAVKESYERSKKSFHADVSTVDIDQFLINEDLLLDSGVDSASQELELIERAEAMVGNDVEAVRVAREWSKTRLFESLNFMSCAMVETAISNKQHCHGKQMILKKIRNYEAYMLLHPTKSSEHCFVSFFFPWSKETKILAQLPFTTCVETDAGWITDFVSFKPGKLENKASGHSSLLSLASYWAWFYELPDATPEAFLQQKTREALKMLLLSVLIRAEDKESTEFVITQTRYMFMEVFKSNVSLTNPNPLKFLKKLRTIIRSRLTMWLTLNIVKHFQYMSSYPPIKSKARPTEDSDVNQQQEVPARDQWDNLLNPLTGGPLKTFTNAINIAYLGYLKNKNDGSEGNVEYGLVQKIIDQEISLDNTPDCDTTGLPVADFPKAKGFNMDSIAQGTQVMQRRLRKSLGEEYKQVLAMRITSALGGKLSEEIATLKASCTIPHENLHYQTASLSRNMAAGRIKVLEAVYNELDLLKLNPYFSLNEIVNVIESTSGGIVADIFKKSQHGGLREIFVLTIKSRVIQLFVETTARVICSEFIEETMTHPDSKMSRLDEHMVFMDTAAHSTDSVVKHICSSRDKSKWSQQMMMRSFYFLLTRFLPEWMHPAIRRCLNMWVRKHIKMPQRVLNLLCQGTILDDESYRILLEDFNEGGSLVNAKSGTMLTPTTGMMQGILHYTSSLLHVAFLNYLDEQTNLFMRTLYPDMVIKITQVCSSDDSSSILSVMGPPGTRPSDDRFRQAVAVAMVIQEQQGNLSKLFGMTDSEKSAENLFNTIEFNSEFRSENTIVSPVIKFVAASLTMSESESLLKRQEGQYGLLSQTFSSGLPAFNTRICQISQGILHYRTMGCGISPLFGEYMNRLQVVPDPIFGFFLTDVQYFPGLLGLGFSHWKAHKYSKYSFINLKTRLHNDLEITEEGGVLRSLTVRMGESKKWKSMVDRIRGPLDVDEAIERDPSLLFRKADNIEELKVKLLLRACSPTVGKSMMGGNPFLQALAISVYMLHTHCFTKSSILTGITGNIESEVHKTSLLSEMDLRIEALDPESKWTEAEQRMMFPAIDRYKEVEKVVTELSQYKEVGFQVLRNKRTVYQIQASQTVVSVSLKQLCKFLWFRTAILQPADVVNRAATHYSRLLPWLHVTIEDTLEHSPFETYLELAHFIESFQTKSRKFMRYGPAVTTANFQHKLLLTARRSYKVGVLLTPKFRERNMFRDYELVTKASLTINIPDKKEREKRFVDLMVNSPVLASTSTDLLSLHIRAQKLAIIQQIMRTQYNWRNVEKIEPDIMGQAGILNMIRSTPAGILYTYIMPQQRTENEKKQVRWTGPGEVICLTASLTIRVCMYDDECQYVVVNNYGILLRFPRVLETILRSLMLKSTSSSRHKRPPADSVGTYCRGVFGRPYKDGIPIYQDDRLLNIDAPNCVLETDLLHNEVKVYQRIKTEASGRKQEKKMLVLSWKHNSTDVSIAPDLTQKSDSIYDAWQNQQPLELKAIINQIMLCSELPPDNPVRKWFVELLSSRLSSTCSRDLKLLTRGMDGMALLQAAPDLTIKAMDKEALVDFMNRLIEEGEQSSVVKDLTERFKTSHLFQEIDYGLMDFTGTEADGLIEGPVISDFRRRMILVDELINEGLKESSMFWNDVLSGTMPTSAKLTAENVMNLLNIKVKEHKKSIDDLWRKQAKDNEAKTQARVQTPEVEKPCSPTVIIEIAKDIESLSSEDPPEVSESEYETSDESDTDILEGYNQGLAALEEEKARIDELIKPPVNIEKDLDALERLTQAAGCTRAIQQAEEGLLALAESLGTFNIYTVKQNCSEPERPKVLKRVTHNGDCWFYSFLSLIGQPMTEENVARLRSRLLQSRFLRLSVSPNETEGILRTPQAWADDNITRLASREFGVNVCVHIGQGCLHPEGVYCHYETNPKWPWVHMRYENNSAYDALMMTTLTVIPLDEIHRTTTTTRVILEHLPKRLDSEQVLALRKRAQEERKNAEMANVILKAIGGAQSNPRWKGQSEAKKSLDASYDAWHAKFSGHVVDYNLITKGLASKADGVVHKTPDCLPLSESTIEWSNMTQDTTLSTALSHMSLDRYKVPLESLLSLPSSSHDSDRYREQQSFMSSDNPGSTDPYMTDDKSG